MLLYNIYFIAVIINHHPASNGATDNNCFGKLITFFIIHPCDPAVVICYLIRPCDIAVCITYLISHSYSLTYNLRIFQFGCIINTKLPSFDDISRHTSLVFPSGCPESTHLTDRCVRAPAVKTL